MNYANLLEAANAAFVWQEDMGKIIGKQGRVAKSLRTIVQCAAMQKKEKVYLEIR